jgi:hypothetical protein
MGDYQLGFKPVNINDIPKPCVVLLRYNRNMDLVVVKVKATDRAVESNPSRSLYARAKRRALRDRFGSRLVRRAAGQYGREAGRDPGDRSYDALRSTFSRLRRLETDRAGRVDRRLLAQVNPSRSPAAVALRRKMRSLHGNRKAWRASAQMFQAARVHDPATDPSGSILGSRLDSHLRKAERYVTESRRRGDIRKRLMALYYQTMKEAFPIDPKAYEYHENPGRKPRAFIAPPAGVMREKVYKYVDDPTTGEPVRTSDYAVKRMRAEYTGVSPGGVPIRLVMTQDISGDSSSDYLVMGQIGDKKIVEPIYSHAGAQRRMNDLIEKADDLSGMFDEMDIIRRSWRPIESMPAGWATSPGIRTYGGY